MSDSIEHIECIDVYDTVELYITRGRGVWGSAPPGKILVIRLLII